MARKRRIEREDAIYHIMNRVEEMNHHEEREEHEGRVFEGLSYTPSRSQSASGLGIGIDYVFDERQTSYFAETKGQELV